MKHATVTTAWFIIAALLSVAGMVIWNDAVYNISYGLRFIIVLFGVLVFFVIPAVVLEIRKKGCTPLWFDAALVPFLAVLIHRLIGGSGRFDIFWDIGFWAVLGVPSIVLTYLFCRYLRKKQYSSLIAPGFSIFVLLLMLGVLDNLIVD